MSNEIITKIKSQGYWEIIIRPISFTKDRLSNLAEAEQQLRACQVKLRGWYFPHIGKIKRGLDFIEESVSFRGINEAWRFYQSGQLIFYRGLSEDWCKSEGYSQEFEPGEALSILSALFALSETFDDQHHSFILPHFKCVILRTLRFTILNKSLGRSFFCNCLYETRPDASSDHDELELV